jgi:hypothetical protein
LFFFWGMKRENFNLNNLRVRFHPSIHPSITPIPDQPKIGLAIFRMMFSSISLLYIYI